MTRYHDTQRYEPYSSDRAFMAREGEPCRHCLRTFHDHHNGRCPMEDDEPTREQAQIIEHVRQRELALLDPTQPILMTLLNPFRRRGATASDVACFMDWWTGRVLKSGRHQEDTQRARKALTEMVKAGLLVELGRERTLHCGSRSKAMYATPGFQAEAEALLAQHGVPA